MCSITWLAGVVVAVAPAMAPSITLVWTSRSSKVFSNLSITFKEGILLLDCFFLRFNLGDLLQLHGIDCLLQCLGHRAHVLRYTLKHQDIWLSRERDSPHLSGVAITYKNKNIPSWSPQSALDLLWRQLWRTFARSSKIHFSFCIVGRPWVMYKTVFNHFFHLKCKVHIHSLQGSADNLMAFSAYIRPLSTSPSLKHFFNLACVWIVWCNNRSCFPQLKKKLVLCFYLFFVLISFCFLAHLFQLFWCEFQLKQHLGGIHTSKKRISWQ